MAHTLYVVGIGPGNPEYVVPRGLHLIKQAKVLVGSERALEDFAQPGQATFPIAKLAPMAEWMGQQLQSNDIVVLVSGDTGYYSLLPYLKTKFPNNPIDVTPGISSMTFAFARLGEVWHNADLMSFHGRRPEEKDLYYAEGRKLGFLTDPEQNPAYIARHLIEEHGWPKDTKAAACERLSYEDERIERGTLEELQKLEGFGHSVMVVLG